MEENKMIIMDTPVSQWGPSESSREHWANQDKHSTRLVMVMEISLSFNWK